MLCAVGFTILGLLAAVGITFTSDKQDLENSSMIYAVFMFGGLIGGLVVGCLATIIGAKLNQK